ncbi:hypothetical protein BDI4_570045 [Burkholderia diffusa]|nr:hypothetical protein BDI4_570045 [Burkholderia diffusa]
MIVFHYLVDQTGILDYRYVLLVPESGRFLTPATVLL